MFIYIIKETKKRLYEFIKFTSLNSIYFELFIVLNSFQLIHFEGLYMYDKKKRINYFKEKIGMFST